MMYKIINNLLSNAFKFTPQNGHIQLTVNKADRNDKEYIMIEVSDTGCGIDEKDLPHIFERFYQIKDDNAPAEAVLACIWLKNTPDYITEI